MHEAVSDVLDLRMRESDGLSRMLVVSLTAHVALLSAVVLMPADWLTAKTPAKLKPMFISLGGAVGPNAGGMTQLSGRSVQAVAPPEPKRVETPPAAKAPEMSVPDPKLRPNPRTPAKVEKPVDKAASRKPTTGSEVKTGDARADTGAAPIPFGGLSTGGSGTREACEINVGDFCCPEYVAAMNQRIRENWNKDQGASGTAVMKFIIQRDGTLSGIEIDQSSRNPVLDLESRRALFNTRRLPPLPAAYTPPTLTVLLSFEYKR